MLTSSPHCSFHLKFCFLSDLPFLYYCDHVFQYFFYTSEPVSSLPTFIPSLIASFLLALSLFYRRLTCYHLFLLFFVPSFFFFFTASIFTNCLSTFQPPVFHFSPSNSPIFHAILLLNQFPRSCFAFVFHLSLVQLI